jgi:hypothetical protein
MRSLIFEAAQQSLKNRILSFIRVAIVMCSIGSAMADSHLVSDTITLQSGSVCMGSQASYSLDLVRVESGKMTINLTAQGLPAGVSTVFTPAAVELGGNSLTGQASLILSIGPNVPPGDYTFSVIASAGGVNNTITNSVPLGIGMCTPGIVKMTDGCVCVGFETVPGQRYVIQATPDLTVPVWTDICTTNMTANLLVFADMDSTNHPMRFYRSALVQ